MYYLFNIACGNISRRPRLYSAKMETWK